MELQRLLDTCLDVAIMAVIFGSFLWGGYAFKTEPLVVRPAETPLLLVEPRAAGAMEIMNDKCYPARILRGVDAVSNRTRLVRLAGRYP